MANLLDYLAWRGDLPLSAVPLCDVDALIFARLSYVPFDGIAESRVPLYMAARQGGSAAFDAAAAIAALCRYPAGWV